MIAIPQTQILGSPHLRWQGIHASIRFRFRESGNIEQGLDSALPGNCWKSGFLNFDISDGLSGSRFSDYAVGAPENQRRAQMVGEILHYNSRLYLDSFRPAQGGFRFESNGDVNNRLLGGNPIQSVLHMILNPRFLAEQVMVTSQRL